MKYIYVSKVAKLNKCHLAAIRVNIDSGKKCYDDVKCGKYKFGKSIDEQ